MGLHVLCEIQCNDVMSMYGVFSGVYVLCFMYVV